MPVHEIESLREERASLYEQMKEINDLAVEEKRDLTGEDQEKYDRLEGKFDELTRSIDRTEKLEGIAPKMERSKAAPDEEQRGNDSEAEKPIENYRDYVTRNRAPWDDNEYRQQFYRWLQTGEQPDDEVRSRIPHELRVQSKATAGAGANIVPVGFGERIMAVERDVGVMAQLANVITTDSGEQINYPTVTAHGTASWIAENGSYSGSDETFGQASLSAYKDGTMVLVSEELLSDSAFDLEAYLVNELGLRIGVLANTAYWQGNGSGKPTGISTTVTTGVTAATGNTTTIPADNVFDLVHSVKVAYRRNASFVANDAGIKALRKLKDTTNQYLWQPGLTAGQPDTLLSRPIYTDPDVAVPAANALSLYYGDFNRAYVIRNTGGYFLQRLTERYADNGQVGFRAYKRTDGKQVNTEAVKAFANSAT